MSSKLSQDFIDEMEAEGISEERLIRHITNAVTVEDNGFMFNNKFNIADILNGRIDESKVPMLEVRDMVKRWNKELGVNVIFEEFV